MFENDIVNNGKRIKLIINHGDDLERWTSFWHSSQTILREDLPRKKTKYTVYEQMTLSLNAFDLKDTVYLIVDDKVFPRLMHDIRSTQHRQYDEETESVLKADSTTVSVVTGISETASIKVRFNYTLTDDIVKHISRCDELMFRYYAGPDMMTLLVKPNDLKRLKAVIKMKL